MKYMPSAKNRQARRTNKGYEALKQKSPKEVAAAYRLALTQQLGGQAQKMVDDAFGQLFAENAQLAVDVARALLSEGDTELYLDALQVLFFHCFTDEEANAIVWVELLDCSDDTVFLKVFDELSEILRQAENLPSEVWSEATKHLAAATCRAEDIRYT